MAHLLPRIAAELFNRPLLVEQAYLDVMLTAIADRLAIEPLAMPEALQAAHRPERATVYDKTTGIAIVPIVGGMTHRAGYDAESGSIGYTGIQSELLGVAKKGAKGIILDMDTPGGSVAGLHATSSFLSKLNKDIPVYSVANSMIASAGMWLASATDKIFAAPGSSIGSIGVVTAHRDVSGAMARAGVAHTYIYAGKGKVDGNPYEPLSEEVRASIQQTIDELYSEFVGHVAANRGVSPQSIVDFGAAMFAPKQAVERGLADGVASLDEAISLMRERLRGPLVQVGALPTTTPKSGATGKMSELQLYSRDEVDAAIASATRTASVEASAAISKVRGETAAEFVHAMTEIFGEDPRAQAFAEVIAEGGTISLATKMAKRFAAPTAHTAREISEADMQAHLERRFGAAAPHVPSDTAAAAGDRKTEADARAARLAELKAVGASIGRAPVPNGL